MNKGKQVGFSLIELMIALAIVVVLGNISVGYYLEYVKSGYRSEGKSALVQLANAMERFKVENNTYVGTHTGGVPDSSFFPATAPLGSAEPQYDLTIAATVTTYELTATPRSGTRMDDDGVLTLSYTGSKSYAGSTGWD